MKYYLQNIQGLIGPVPGKISKLIAISLNKTDVMIFWSDSVNISSLDEAIAGEDDTKMMTPFKTNEAILANKPQVFIGEIDTVWKTMKESQSWSEEVKIGFRPTYFKAIVHIESSREGYSSSNISYYIFEGFSNGLITRLGTSNSGVSPKTLGPFGAYNSSSNEWLPPSISIADYSHASAGPFSLNNIQKTNNGLLFIFNFRRAKGNEFRITYRVYNIIAW